MGGLLMKGKENLSAVRRPMTSSSNVAPLGENRQSRCVPDPETSQSQVPEVEQQQSSAENMDFSDASSASSLNSTSKVRKQRDLGEEAGNSRKRIRVSSARVPEIELKRPRGEEPSGSPRKRARVGESPGDETSDTSGGRRKRIDDVSGSSRKRAKIECSSSSSRMAGDRGIHIDEERVKKRRLDSRKRKREVSECDDEEDFGGTGVKPDFSSDSEIQERFAQSLSF